MNLGIIIRLAREFSCTSSDFDEPVVDLLSCTSHRVSMSLYFREPLIESIDNPPETGYLATRFNVHTNYCVESGVVLSSKLGIKSIQYLEETKDELVCK